MPKRLSVTSASAEGCPPCRRFLRRPDWARHRFFGLRSGYICDPLPFSHLAAPAIARMNTRSAGSKLRFPRAILLAWAASYAIYQVVASIGLLLYATTRHGPTEPGDWRPQVLFA